MSTTDLDPAIKSALSHLHSTQVSSASEIRILLDGFIKKQLGSSSRMLINRLSKKQLAEEETAPGVVASVPEPLEIMDSPPHEEKMMDPEPEVEEVTECLNLIEDEPAPEPEDIEMNEDFNDLNCVVCDSMMYSATNGLKECLECHSLYHQQCHTPKIEDDSMKEDKSWICTNCKEKTIPTKTLTHNILDQPQNILGKSSSSSSAPSSASSSPYHKSTEPPALKPVSSTSKGSSSSSLKEEKVTKSSKSETTLPKHEKSSSSSGKKHKSSKSSHSKDHHEKKSKKSK